MAMSLLVRMFVGALTLQVAAALTASEKANVVAKQQALFQGMSSTDPLAMLESVEKMARSGETVPSATATTIKALVTEIRDTLTATVADARNTKENNFKAFTTGDTACTAPGAEAPSDDQATIDYRATHATCRTEQYDPATGGGATTHCDRLNTFLAGIGAGPSDWPAAATPPTQAERTAQVSKIGEYSTMNMCNKEEVGTLNDACKTESDASGTKEATCREDQLRFEASYCTMASRRETDCTAYTACFTGKTEAYEAAATDYADLKPKLEVEHKALAKIDCFCNVWIAGNQGADGSFAACEAADYSTTDLDINFNSPAVPTVLACPLFEETPGEPGFVTQEYTVAKVGTDKVTGEEYPCSHLADSKDKDCTAIEIAKCPLTRCAIKTDASTFVNTCGEKGLLLELKTNKTKAPAQLMELHADGTMHEEPTQHHKKRSMIRRETKRHAHLDAQGQVAHQEAHKRYDSADLQGMDMLALMKLMKTLDINTKDVKAAMEKSILNAKV